MNQILFSSKKQDWETPQDLFDMLDAKHHFTLDVCATPENAKCARYFTPDHDGILQTWAGICWMNPPYGRNIGDWVQKAFTSSLEGAKVVCLLPARTDTKWFHEWVLGKGEIEFIRGRLRFGGAKNTAPFPSMIIVYEKEA